MHSPSTEEECKSQCTCNITVLKETRWQCAFITKLELRQNEEDCKDTKADEQTDNSGTVPRICRSTPLQGQK